MAALEDILLRIGHIMEPVCSGGSFDDGMGLSHISVLSSHGRF